ncbi:3-deoxy-manno-octulosonate cytidylyltransferase [uncultured Fusobacterium sp.]|uniref:3-deoxy-manno-octulosonate cytidylyltransferase n=1 Tax=uncultured Fusobacterium sp. TaxID=159267 RepID=UPI0025E83542|nr:3-deoxy-manno-octulosonate cytidylyltransferase [uncultured Fusobacterium sp.]
MKFLGVIPSRYASTRLEGKPLKDICGHTMVEWVYKRALKSKLDGVVVATDDERIVDEVKSFGGNVILTRKDHINGTSRIAEVCETYTDYDVIVNIQGDEPLIEPDMINSIIDSFIEDNTIPMSTLKYKLTDMAEIENPNAVKVVTDKNDFAIYFSRSVIPYPRNLNMVNYYKHVGIYGYKRDFVMEYAKMASTPLELSESLEQLRVLENGYKIKVLETPYKIIGVDTQEELERVREYITKNGLVID